MRGDEGAWQTQLPTNETARLLQPGGEEETGGSDRSFFKRARLRIGLFALVAAWAFMRPRAPSRLTTASSPKFQAEEELRTLLSPRCLDSYELSDFSSKGNMELAGWSFNWDDEFTFKPPIYQMYAPSTAYWGCSKHGGGTISLTLQGQGVLTLDFGNSWGNETSSVTVFLNGAKQSVAGPYTFSKTVKIAFNDGDTLDIVEGPSGVIVINSITFRCVATTPPPATFTSTSTGTATTTTITFAYDVPTYTATTTTTTKTTTPNPATSTVTTSSLKDIEDAKRKWLHEYDELQRKRLEERKKKEQLEHQLELERAVLDRIRKEREELKEATQAEKEALEKAKEEREREQEKRDELIRKRKEREERDKEQAKQKEEKERVTRETKLAKAVAEQKQHTKEELKRLKTEREHEQKEEEEMAEHMEDELEKEAQRKSKKGTQGSVSVHGPDLKAPSLYCYSLMLPFGYEPALLRSQKDRKVGIFSCNEYAVFSNSTNLLDKKEPVPLHVTLLNFSLAVPYGGKWHTALNTGVFNGVWTTIVSLGKYRMHDWVVKADPDSVFFPKRLVRLLQTRKPMDRVMNTVSTRRLYEEASTGRRLQWDAPKNASCGTCMMPGFEGQSCNSHVQYIQQQGHSCTEAIRRVARLPPTDCGCDCNRIESCDFKMDPKMYRNHQVIQGKAYPGAMYINNCKFGLHGPIEVLTARAVTAYVEGLPRCNNLLVHPWGEDKFMDRCMLELGITRVNEFGLLSEIACGETPAPCGHANVAFHPFKSIHSYFACWEYANRYGRGPVDSPHNRSRHGDYVV